MINLDESVLNFFKLFFNQQIALIFFYFYFFFYFLLLIYVLYLYFFERNYKKFKRFLALTLIGFIVINTLKYTVSRERPTSFLKKEDYSFPSSHAYFSTLLFLFSPSSLFGLITKLYSIITIFSTLYIPLHYFSDVIFSIALAVVFNSLFQQDFLERIERKLKEIVKKMILKRKIVVKKL